MPKSFRILFFLGLLAPALLNACAEQPADPPPPSAAPTPRVRVVVVTAAPTHTPIVPTRTSTSAPTAVPAPTATPFITPPPPGETVNIPILMYHHFNPLPSDASELLRTWTVAPEQFTAQLDYLKARGFNTITLQQLAAFFEQGAPLPPNPIVITIDDGWIDAYTFAFPELNKRNMVAVFFVPTNYATAGGELLINWNQVIEMDRAGMEIGGHTISHADLTRVTLAQARRQLMESKNSLQEKLGHPIVALSYPYGAHDAPTIAETRAAGYKAAVILCCGYKQSSELLLTLPRIRVSYDDTLEYFVKRLP